MSRNSNKNQDPPLTEPVMLEAIKKSGYLIELRIEEKLYAKDYTTLENPVYFDAQTKKNREYDLLAKSNISRNFGDDIYSWEIICECENNEGHPIVFFEQGINNEEPYIDSIKSAGMFDLLKEIPLYTQGFPYHYDTHASQYCNFTLVKDGNGQRKWIAKHTDEQYKTFDSLVKVVKHRYRELAPSDKPKDFPKINGVIQFPVLVLQGEMYKAVGNSVANLSLERIDLVKYRVSDFDSSTNEYSEYYIHVVTENFFDQLLEQIEVEAEFILSRIVEKGAMVREKFRKEIGTLPRMI